MFVVSMRSDYEIVREVVFNVKPDAVFSDDSQMLLYVQKSEEGGFTELVARKVETLLHTHAEVEPVGTELSHRDVSGHIIFKCPSTK